MQALPLTRIVGLLVLAAPLVALARGASTPTQEQSLADVRAELTEAYSNWGRARVEIDEEAYESTLAPDFYVLLNGERVSREGFLGMISRPSGLTRFDVEVLTVRPKDGAWEAVIAEKLEFEGQAPDGSTQRMCSLWITRDGARQVDGEWQFLYSEEIGHENWRPGTSPPFADWEE